VKEVKGLSLAARRRGIRIRRFKFSNAQFGVLPKEFTIARCKIEFIAAGNVWCHTRRLTGFDRPLTLTKESEFRFRVRHPEASTDLA